MSCIFESCFIGYPPTIGAHFRFGWQWRHTKNGNERSRCPPKDEQRHSMHCDDNCPMSTGNDDTSEGRGVPAPSPPGNASHSTRRDDKTRIPPAVSAPRGALAPHDAPRRQGSHEAEPSHHRASTIYASVPVGTVLPSESMHPVNDNPRLACNDHPTAAIGVRLHDPIGMRVGGPRNAPDQPAAKKRPAEDSSQPASKRHASQMNVGPLAPPPALPTRPVPSAPTLPSNNAANSSNRMVSGAAIPPIRSVNYQAHPLLSGMARNT